jgi:NADPH:quinone reductase-like Zn-dependent oxidoreductase
MKAIRIHGYGGLEVLRYEEVPVTQLGPGEVLVKVHAAAINPVDWKVRAGYVRDWLKHKLPLIPGWDFSGVIEEAGTSPWKKGDAVYARPDISRDGAYAEYIAVRASEIAAKPKSIDHVEAAAIPLTALTAWQALFDAAGPTAGQKVLIHAAAGGVGHFGVQFAKCKGRSSQEQPPHATMSFSGRSAPIRLSITRPRASRMLRAISMWRWTPWLEKPGRGLGRFSRRAASWLRFSGNLR